MLDALEKLLRHHPRWVVLTGAGLSAASGIPPYRDDEGRWLRSDPIQHQEFITRPEARSRYWARSMSGWRYMARSKPNQGHRALSRLEDSGHVELLVTQNVDRLHQKAGHRRVVDLHGRIDRVRCLSCGELTRRTAVQQALHQLNPEANPEQASIRPDGDAEVPDDRIEGFRAPECDACGGILMPDVVFFGGAVPRERVREVEQSVSRADALVAVGTSLMVFSGFRFCRQAEREGKPIVIINRGTTRADPLAALKVTEDAGPTLQFLADRLASAH